MTSWCPAITPMKERRSNVGGVRSTPLACRRAKRSRIQGTAYPLSRAMLGADVRSPRSSITPLPLHNSPYTKSSCSSIWGVAFLLCISRCNPHVACGGSLVSYPLPAVPISSVIRRRAQSLNYVPRPTRFLLTSCENRPREAADAQRTLLCGIHMRNAPSQISTPVSTGSIHA
jgi:hypothetical protein